jgi:hypothetical protein
MFAVLLAKQAWNCQVGSFYDATSWPRRRHQAPASLRPRGKAQPADGSAKPQHGGTGRESNGGGGSKGAGSKGGGGGSGAATLMPWSCSDGSLLQLIAGRDPTGRGLGSVLALRLLQRLLHWDPAQVGAIEARGRVTGQACRQGLTSPAGTRAACLKTMLDRACCCGPTLPAAPHGRASPAPRVLHGWPRQQ